MADKPSVVTLIETVTEFWTQLLLLAGMLFAGGKLWTKYEQNEKRISHLEVSFSELFNSKEEGGGFRFVLLKTCEEREKEMEAAYANLCNNSLSEIRKLKEEICISLKSNEGEMKKALIEIAKVSVKVEQQGKQVELSLERIHDMEINRHGGRRQDD